MLFLPKVPGEERLVGVRPLHKNETRCWGYIHAGLLAPLIHSILFVLQKEAVGFLPSKYVRGVDSLYIVKRSALFHCIAEILLTIRDTPNNRKFEDSVVIAAVYGHLADVFGRPRRNSAAATCNPYHISVKSGLSRERSKRSIS